MSLSLRHCTVKGSFVKSFSFFLLPNVYKLPSRGSGRKIGPVRTSLYKSNATCQRRQLLNTPSTCLSPTSPRLCTHGIASTVDTSDGQTDNAHETLLSYLSTCPMSSSRPDLASWPTALARYHGIQRGIDRPTSTRTSQTLNRLPRGDNDKIEVADYNNMK